ncbi:MAG: hypothetical protein NZP74_01175 [Anaerolineales bacterium]|nr:hypothetical protein [Anaerolineales bacterium]MDW8278230.1 hypothetical protein [Anaerolineales bacterium]
MKRKIPFALMLVSLILASLACTIQTGGPDYPATRVPVSTESALTLEEQLKAARTAAAQSGTLSLSVSESQLTSLVAARLTQEESPLLTDPQVYLRDGQIQIYGKATQGVFQANVRIVISATVDASGQPVIEVVSADFGPFPAPEGLNKTISGLIREAFTGALGPAAIGFRLESITITDGTLTLTGRTK